MANTIPPVHRFDTPPAIRKTLVDYHNRNLRMMDTRDLEATRKRLAKLKDGHDVRSRLLLQNITNELAARPA